MKGQFIVLLFINATRLLSQDLELLTSGDSLTVKLTNIASDYSFDFGKSPLGHLMKLGPKIETRAVENMHVQNKVDTMFNLFIGTDKFKVYKLDKDNSMLIHADILTARFKTKQGIQIGMRKQEVIKLIKAYKLTTIPNYLILENLEVPEFLTFKFNNDRLARITFDGYID